ncbi:hypothetical protein D3C81_2086460 [compost metagenome]
MHDVGIAHIHHAHLVLGQVGGVVFVVVGAGMAEGEQRGCLADAARSEAGAGTPLGAHVVRCAKDGDVGVDGFPVGADG